MEQTAAEVERGAAARPARAPAQRERLTLLAWASFLPLLALWHSLTQRLENQPRIPRRQAIRLPLAEGLTVDGQVAIWREGDTLTAVSLRCSHLGCWLRPSGDGGLVCPCHGSRFDGRGRPLRGPARQPLQALAVRVEKARETVVVELPS